MLPSALIALLASDRILSKNKISGRCRQHHILLFILINIMQNESQDLPSTYFNKYHANQEKKQHKPRKKHRNKYQIGKTWAKKMPNGKRINKWILYIYAQTKEYLFHVSFGSAFRNTITIQILLRRIDSCSIFFSRKNDLSVNTFRCFF